MERHVKILTLLDGTLCFNVPTQDGYDKVNLKDIIYLKGESSQASLYLINKKIIVATGSLMYWASPLLKHAFVRVHHSYVINLLYYTHYQKGDGGYVVMNDGSQVSVSAKYKPSFIHVLNDETDDGEQPQSDLPAAG
jgi:two-component system, LytTR family, response regulator